MRKATTLKYLHGSGARRYEALLAQKGFGAPADRPVSPDLDRVSC